MARSEPAPPVLLKYRSSKWLIAFTIFTATFTDGFVYGVIVPVMPFSLVDRSGVPPSEVQFWCSTLLAVHGGSMMLASPVAGWFADRSSSRHLPFLAGLALIFLSTILFMFGDSLALLVMARCLQGCSGGVVFTVGLALLVDTVGREEVGQWLGFVLSGMSTGMMVSPFVGGIVYAKAGYHAVFAMVLAVVAFDFFLRMIMIEKRKARKWNERSGPTEASNYGSVSQGRTVLHEPSPEPSFHSSFEGEDHDDGGSLTSRSEEDELICCPAKSHERGKMREASFFARNFPTMAALLRSPRLMSAVFGSFIITSLTCAFDGVLPLFVSRTFGWGSIGAGVIFLPITIPSLLGPLMGVLSDRYGPRTVSLGGFGLTAPAIALLALVKAGGVGQTALLCILLTLAGLGSAAIYAPLAADLSMVVDSLADNNPDIFGEAGAYAQAYGLFDGAIAAGTVFGPAWAGFMYEKTDWAITAGTLAIICASGAVPVICYTGGAMKQKNGYTSVNEAARV